MKPDTDYNAWLTGFSHLIYQEKAMSQVTLARRVNVDKSYVNTILKGTKTAGYHLQHAIASALGYSHGQVVELGKLILSGVPGEKALEQEVAGSNPAAPTNKINWLCRFFHAKKTPDFSNN